MAKLLSFARAAGKGKRSTGRLPLRAGEQELGEKASRRQREEK
jgi:hypothetical protein